MVTIGGGNAIAGGGGGGASQNGVAWAGSRSLKPDITCDACHGTGTVGDEDCWHCMGEGVDPTK